MLLLANGVNIYVWSKISDTHPTRSFENNSAKITPQFIRGGRYEKLLVVEVQNVELINTDQLH